MLNILTKIITTFSDLIYTISEWESKGLSTEKFMCTYMTNVGVCPRLILMNDSRIRLKLKRSCLKQAHKAPFTPKNVVNLIIAYDLGTSSWNINTDFPWKDSLFGSVELTKNADPDKCKYNGYGIGFDSCSEWLLPDGSMGKNVIIFGIDMSSSEHSDNNKRYLNSWKKTNMRIRW